MCSLLLLCTCTEVSSASPSSFSLTVRSMFSILTCVVVVVAVVVVDAVVLLLTLTIGVRLMTKLLPVRPIDADWFLLIWLFRLVLPLLLLLGEELLSLVSLVTLSSSMSSSANGMSACRWRKVVLAVAFTTRGLMGDGVDPSSSSGSSGIMLFCASVS